MPIMINTAIGYIVIMPQFIAYQGLGLVYYVKNFTDIASYVFEQCSKSSQLIHNAPYYAHNQLLQLYQLASYMPQFIAYSYIYTIILLLQLHKHSYAPACQLAICFIYYYICYAAVFLYLTQPAITAIAIQLAMFNIICS